MFCQEKRPEMLKATIDALARFQKEPYPTSGKKDIIKWWWCDALFMAPPVLVKLGVVTNDNSYIEYNDKCFKECYELLYNKKERLFAREFRLCYQGRWKG